MRTNKRSAKVITFYSYKGGTGRSMILANVAWILASQGKRVLAIDWDLEAPGLHRYFSPFLLDPEMTSTKGIIEFVMDFQDKVLTPPADAEIVSDDWYLKAADLSYYATSINWDFPPDPNGRKGGIDIVCAGQQSDDYAEHVNNFNWRAFYDKLGGGAFLNAAKKIVTEDPECDYDYILIDSRTGVTDTSGICTVQLPDALVVCFTLNNQGVEGSASVAKSVRIQRDASSLAIFPVSMRTDTFEKERLERRRNYAKEKFGSFPDHIRNKGEWRRYWGDVEVPYISYYGYEEVLSTFGDDANDHISILRSAERLTKYLTNGEVQELNTDSVLGKEGVLARYAQTATPETEAQIGRESELAEKLAEAIEERDSERKVGRGRLYLIASLIVFVIVTSTLSFYVYRRSKAISRSRELAGKASILIIDNPDLSVLLAREAVRVSPTLEAEEALRNSLLASVGSIVLEGHTERVLSGTFSPDGKYVVTASEDKTARIWEVLTGHSLIELKVQTGNAVFSPDGKYIVTAGYDKTPRIWEAATGLLLEELKGHTSSINSAVFSPDGKVVATASDDNTARTWDAATGRLLWEFKGHTDALRSAAFSPNGKLIVTASYDNTARIWDVASGRQVQELRGHSGSVYNAIFSPDNKSVVTASEDNTARIWDVATGRSLRELKGHTGVVSTAIFSGDGKLVVTASSDNTARIWEVATGGLLQVLRGHKDFVYRASFSPDSRLVVTASADKTALLWEVSTGRSLQPLQGHSDSVYDAVFSPDGRNIVTASADKTARVWSREDLGDLRSLMELAGKKVPRELTAEERRIYLNQ